MTPYIRPNPADHGPGTKVYVSSYGWELRQRHCARRGTIVDWNRKTVTIKLEPGYGFGEETVRAHPECLKVLE